MKQGADPLSETSEQFAAESDPSDPDTAAEKRHVPNWRVMLRSVLLVLLVATIATYYLADQQSRFDLKYNALLNDQQAYAQEMAKDTHSAVGGAKEGFQELRKASNSVDATLHALSLGGANERFASPPRAIDSRVEELLDKWRKVSRNVDQVLAVEETVITVRDKMKAFNTVISDAVSAADDLANGLTQAGASAAQRYVAGLQIVIAQQIAHMFQGMSEDANESVVGSTEFGRSAVLLALFGQAIDGFFNGDKELGIRRIPDQDQRAILSRLRSLHEKATRLLRDISNGSVAVSHVGSAAGAVTASSKEILNDTGALRNAYRAEADKRLVSAQLANVLGVMTLIAFVLVAWELSRSSRARAEENAVQAEQARMREEEINDANRRNQAAILQLLDEIADLADGDLTVRATVTEDMTGAIADAINYSIDALRELVTNINSTSVVVASSAQMSRNTAIRLSEASERQATQIAQVTKSIREMAGSVERVSAHAVESSEVAQQSVKIANKGGKAVRDTIQGMDAIRETMQETAKRIKRLGESSQEIGDIVGLINDIADQTNILALNAAIQASMAGEAGRGFAVVADEVQRLAERASQATKQIETLVNTIQTDTNEAVSSMEESTAGVVTGAKIAQGAGESLEEIENVSQSLAKLIRNISQASGQQANQAADVAKTMSAIQNITTQTRTGTKETANSVGNLADLASVLKTSVAGFQLPEKSTETVVDDVSNETQLSDVALPERNDMGAQEIQANVG